MKSPKETLQYLLDSGLLFEINRQVLHPLGKSLVFMVSESPEGAVVTLDGLAEDSDPEGTVFTPELFEQGMRKLDTASAAENWPARLEARVNALGFIVQEEPLEDM